MVIDEFLQPEFAREVVAAYPSFEGALDKGRAFDFVNEKKKVQVTDSSKFPPAVKRLEQAIASQSFRDALSQITGIPKLLADEQLVGGGMHVMGSHGRLDVHVDFNLIEERQLHRRLNILVYLNPVWGAWGGHIELWDRESSAATTPFCPPSTAASSSRPASAYHGVAAVKCPDDVARKKLRRLLLPAKPRRLGRRQGPQHHLPRPPRRAPARPRPHARRTPATPRDGTGRPRPPR
ncbi:MAG: 2OG-Fe(II) oxygenase [Nannocystaceae bacterium]